MRSPCSVLAVLTTTLMACAGSVGDPPAEQQAAAAAHQAAAGQPTGAVVTLARRIVAGGKVHTLGVKSHTSDWTSFVAVDLSEAFGVFPSYPLDLVTTQGFDAVLAAVNTKPTTEVALADLAPPVDETSAHVATALNYPEHQEETKSEATPYLFPKIAKPTPSNTEVARQAGDLLDYEVEMCVVFGATITSASEVATQLHGLMTCNDLSNRAAQVMGADTANPELAKGFTDAKSRAGFLPLGPVVVVPRDPSFAMKRSLRLSVNGQKRQDDTTASMVWNIETIVEKVLEVGSDPRFELAGKPVAPLPTGKIEKGQILVTGTPGGVIFRPPSTAFKAKKIGAWLSKGGPLSGMDPETFVKTELVAELQASGDFLKPGDRVDCEIDGLGPVHVRIAGTND